MRIRVMYEVVVDGVKYAPGVVEVGQGVGMRLVEEHRGNFEEEKEEPPRARRAQREEPKEDPVAAVVELAEEDEPKEEE